MSWHQTIPNTINHVKLEHAQSILEIGNHLGKYGFLLREALEKPQDRFEKDSWNIKIDGLLTYCENKSPIYGYIYNHVYYGDLITIINSLPQYDVIFLDDISNYCSKEMVLNLIENLLKHTKKALFIPIPIFPNHHRDYMVSSKKIKNISWSIVDFQNFDYTFQEFTFGDNGVRFFKFFPQKESQANPIDNLLLSNSITTIRNKPLTITYVIPHKNLTGGLKMLLEQIKHLRKRGHVLQVAFRGTSGESSLPDWIKLEVDKEILVPNDKQYVPYIINSDVIVAGWFNQLHELVNDKIPVFYWEQGHELLFGDFSNQTEELKIRNFLKDNYSQKVAIASVSTYVTNVLYSKFGRKALVLPNFIDTSFYYPSELGKSGKTVLLVGNPSLNFKGFDVALKSLEYVWNTGYRFNVKWISPINLNLKGYSFPIEVIVNPPQEKLATIYRFGDMLLSTSWYEGFSMPPLEAMASGIPVVATNNGGIEVYAKPGENSIIVEPGNIEELSMGIIHLLNEKDARIEFGKKGRETAQIFNYDSGILFLEEILYKLVNQYQLT